MCTLGTTVFAAFFDRDGRLIEVEQREPTDHGYAMSEAERALFEDGETRELSPFKFGKEYHDTFAPRATAIVDIWRRELGFANDTIEVEPFFISSLGVGIRDMPRYLEEYSREPDSPLYRELEEEDIEGFEEHLHYWTENLCFVLHLGAEYWMHGDGSVEST